VPGLVGLPVTVPLLGLSVQPGGRLPDATCAVCGDRASYRLGVAFDEWFTVRTHGVGADRGTSSCRRTRHSEKPKR
jgi:hypothetical protein